MTLDEVNDRLPPSAQATAIYDHRRRVEVRFLFRGEEPGVGVIGIPFGIPPVPADPLAFIVGEVRAHMAAHGWAT